MGAEFGLDGFDVPDEDAGVPEIAAVSKIALGDFQGRFFLECLDLDDAVGGAGGMDVAVARVGRSGLDAYAHDGGAARREVQRRLHRGREGRAVGDVGVGRRDDDVGLRILAADLPAGVGDAGGRVAGLRLGENLLLGDVGQLLADEMGIAAGRDHPELRLGIDVQEALVGELDQGLAAAEQVEELLGVLGRTDGVEPAADAAGHDYYVVVHHDFKEVQRVSCRIAC